MNKTVEDQIIAIAIREIEEKNLPATEQFLNVHSVLYENGSPVVEYICASKDGTYTVYFKVKEEQFFLAIVVDMNEKNDVRWTYQEGHNQISFNVDSETYSYDELVKLTKLQPNWGWDKGSHRSPILKKISRIGFIPTPEPDTLESKLNKLLDYLESDIEGIQQLVTKADAYISSTITVHNGNSHIGGVFLEPQTLQRLSALNVSIDFDFYATGNLYKEDDDYINKGVE